MSSSTIRALRVLDEVARCDRPLGVTEIARALSLPPGSVFRSLDALLRAGLVARYRASARYVPGPAVERLHRSLVTRFPVREVCLPYLRQLVSISGETASLHVRIGWYAVGICSVPGMGEVMTVPAGGKAHALSETFAGQVILAFLPKPEIAEYRTWFKSAAPSPLRVEGRKAKSPVDRSPLGNRFSGGKSRASLRPSLIGTASLNQITTRGFAAGDGAIAFPIRANGRAVAAITIERPFPAAGRTDQLSACKDVISNIEALAFAQPSLFTNPFAHLESNSLTL